MTEAAPIAVHGRSRLIVDIIEGVLAGRPATGARPVAVLVDPDPEHWAAARDAACVLVSSSPTIDLLDALRRGADAVVHAEHVVTTLPEVVSAVQAGGAVLEPTQARVVVDALRSGASLQPLRLTKREEEIMRSIIGGESVKQTAKGLGIAPKTVENLQSRLFKKLEVRNRAQAVARVHELGLLDGVNTPEASGGDRP
jgi:DNA-binding NarL/FixJ family response regulator